MSTSEKWTATHSSCPCGKGHVLVHVDSPDNAWSRTIRKYELDCPECAKDWILFDDELRSRSEYEASLDAYSRVTEIERELQQVGRGAIDHILDEARPATIKLEFALLRDAGVCVEGPIRFKRARERGVPASAMCEPIRRIDWIIGRLTGHAISGSLAALVAARRQAREEHDRAHAHMRTILLKELGSAPKKTGKE